MTSLSLSTSWNSRRHTDGAEMLQEIHDLGFTHAELSHGIRYSLWPGILDAVEKGVVQISSLHNFCPVPMGVMIPSPNCYELTDWRPQMRQAAIDSTIDTIQHAAKLHAPAVVMHLGSSGMEGVTKRLEHLMESGRLYGHSYVRTKIAAVRLRQKLYPKIWSRLHEGLKPIVEEAARLEIKLGFEIRESFEEFPNESEFQTVLDAFPAQTVGYWHDFGHGERKDYLGWIDHEATLKKFAPRLFGCHLQDCRPPDVDHLPLGKGTINWQRMRPLIPDSSINVLELSPEMPKEAVLESRNIWNSLNVCAAT